MLKLCSIAVGSAGPSIVSSRFTNQDKTMLSLIYGKWHMWQAAYFLVSDEEIKTLHSFADVDDAINWLWLNGEKEAARALNKAKKG